jgi:hypothetical protein
MAPSSRDRISVDLRGLKVALIERSRAAGLTPSALVRDALIVSLGSSADVARSASTRGDPTDQVRLSLRMSREQAHQTMTSARSAGLAPGAYIAGLVAGILALGATRSIPDHLATLTATNAELATLSRNLHHLATLLRQGEFLVAQEYQPMLDTLARDVHAHLDVATRALRDLQPARIVRPATSPDNRRHA